MDAFCDSRFERSSQGMVELAAKYTNPTLVSSFWTDGASKAQANPAAMTSIMTSISEHEYLSQILKVQEFWLRALGVHVQSNAYL